MNGITCTPFGSEYDSVMEGWQPKENEDGVIYFANSFHRSTTWTHPYVEKIFEELSELNDVRYAAYRTALKMRCLQKKSGLSWLTIKGIKKILNYRGEPKDSYRASVVSHKEAFNAIISMFEASDSLCIHRLHFVKAASIIVSLLIEMYDTNYEGKFPLSSFKFCLIALCSAQLSEKYRFLFSEIYGYSDHIIQRERLLYLFYDLMQITNMLKESTAFGTNVSSAVDSCLNYCTSVMRARKSSEDAFYSWLLLEPQIIVWLPTLHRVAATENVCHEVQCSSCGINPFKGFRYRCLQCFKYDLCQDCFFLGKVSLAHKLKHPLQEYCLPATKKDSTKAVLKILRNKLSKKHRSQSKITYLPLDDDSITGSVFQWQPHHHLPSSKEVHCGSSDSGLACSSENDTLPAVDSSCCDVEEAEMETNPMKPRVAEEKCPNMDELSKKDMIDQQSFMARMIEELQAENRHLHARLQMLATQESSDVVSNSSSNAYIETNTEAVLEITHSPTRESNLKLENAQDYEDPNSITVDKTNCELHIERQMLHDSGGSKKIYIHDNSDNDSLPNVLEIVGYYTPVRPSFCESESVLDAQNLDSMECAPVGEAPFNKVSVVGPVNELPTSESESNAAVRGNVCRKTCIEITTKANSEKDDITSESTVCEGLEYGYSDMSLHSGSQSQKISFKESKTLPSEKEPLESSLKVIVSETSLNTERDSEKNTQNNFYAEKIMIKQDCKTSGDDVCDTDTSKSLKQEKEKQEPVQTGQTISFSQTTEMNTNEIFFNISDILPDCSTIPALSIMSNKPVTPGNDQFKERRLTIEPVFMSTPVIGDGQQPQLSKTIDSKKVSGKENRVPDHVKEGKLQLIAAYKCKGQSGVTPKSAVLSKQSKKLLSSRENLSSDSRSDTIDLSTRDVGMTTMFDKAERLGVFDGVNVGDSLAHADKEEMDKLVQKVNMANGSSPEYYKMQHDSSSSSMLNAVLNVGDAMADLVQATAEKQEK